MRPSVLGAFALVLMLSSTAFVASPSRAQNRTDCFWVGEITTNVSYPAGHKTADGTLWDTWERLCITTYTGNARWITWKNGQCVFSQRNNGDGTETWTWEYEKILVSDESGPGTTKPDTTKQTTCPWRGNQPQWSPTLGDVSQPTGYVTDYMTVPSHHSILNSYTDAASFWDGMPFPVGGALSMLDYAPGPHQWLVIPNNPAMHDSLDLTVDIIPSFSFSLVDVSSEVPPTADLTLGSTVPAQVPVTIAVEDLPPGVIGFVDANWVTTPAAPGAPVPLHIWIEAPGGFLAVGGPPLVAFVRARNHTGQVLAEIGIQWPPLTPPTAVPVITEAGFRLLSSNPMQREAHLVLSLPTVGPARVEVFDAFGRRVRSLLDGMQPAGERLVVWDGSNERGRRAPAGIYVLRAEASGETREVRLTLLR